MPGAGARVRAVGKRHGLWGGMGGMGAEACEQGPAGVGTWASCFGSQLSVRSRDKRPESWRGACGAGWPKVATPAMIILGGGEADGLTVQR